MFFLRLVDNLYLRVGCIAAEELAHSTLRVVVQAHNGAYIRRACLHQLQTIAFGFRHGLLMRQHHSRAPGFQAHTSKQTRARVALTAVSKHLLIAVIARRVILSQNVLNAPFSQHRGGACVAIIEYSVAWLISPQFQTNDIVGVSRIVARLRLLRNHVIGWRDNLRQIPYSLAHIAYPL